MTQKPDVGGGVPAVAGPILARGRSLLRQGARTGRRLRAVADVAQLHPPGQSSEAVVTALREALRTRPTSEERPWVRRIEAQRKAMLTSVQPLRFEDFGSGEDRDAILGAEPTSREIPLGEMTARASSSPRWGYLLFRLTRTLRPTSVLELGACVGVSAAYIGAALELNGSGRLTTLEGGQALAERSRHTLSELGLAHRVEVVQGAFADTLAGVLERVAPLQFAFIDGHHQEEPTLAYTEQVLPTLSDEAVVAYDDINWSAGMRRAWDSLDNDPRFAMTLDLGGMGVATVSAASSGPHQKTLLYD